jgi:hypothetical protein
MKIVINKRKDGYYGLVATENKKCVLNYETVESLNIIKDVANLLIKKEKKNENS